MYLGDKSAIHYFLESLVIILVIWILYIQEALYNKIFTFTYNLKWDKTSWIDIIYNIIDKKYHSSLKAQLLKEST